MLIIRVIPVVLDCGGQTGLFVVPPVWHLDESDTHALTHGLLLVVPLDNVS